MSAWESEGKLPAEYCPPSPSAAPHLLPQVHQALLREKAKGNGERVFGSYLRACGFPGKWTTQQWLDCSFQRLREFGCFVAADCAIVGPIQKGKKPSR